MSELLSPYTAPIEEYYANRDLRLLPEEMRKGTNYIAIAALRNTLGVRRAGKIPVEITQLHDPEIDNVYFATLSLPDIVTKNIYSTTATFYKGYWIDADWGLGIDNSRIDRAYLMDEEFDWDGGLAVLRTELSVPRSGLKIPQLV